MKYKRCSGGTIASRFSRYQPRLEAVSKINKMFADKLDAEIEVEYFDGVPSMSENISENIEDEGDEEDDLQ